MTGVPSQAEAAARIQRALILVAARAALLRAALDADDPEDADETITVALDGLRAALDELELSAPAIHAQLADGVEQALRDMRSS